MDYSNKEDILEILHGKLKFLFLPSKNNNYCPKILQGRFLPYCIFCLMILKIILVDFYVIIPRNFFYADITKTVLVNLINNSRRTLGIQPLKESEKLNQIAMLRAEDMIKKEYFSHDSPEGKSPWDWFLEAGYNYKYAGENLAIGFSNSEEIYYAWLDSFPHKENILNPKYKEMGTAILEGFGKNKAILVVQLFGSPAPANEVAFESQKELENNAPQKELKESNTRASASGPIIQKENFLFQENNSGKGGGYYAFLNFATYNYDIFLKNIIYGFLILIAGVLSLWLIYGFNNQYRNILIRSIVFIILLSSMAFIDKELIFSIIYRQMVI